MQNTEKDGIQNWIAIIHRLEKIQNVFYNASDNTNCFSSTCSSLFENFDLNSTSHCHGAALSQWSTIITRQHWYRKFLGMKLLSAMRPHYSKKSLVINISIRLIYDQEMELCMKKDCVINLTSSVTESNLTGLTD